ncbi:MAG TPA: hypothetical protein VGE06_04255 [Flavisolibacter sp.]
MTIIQRVMAPKPVFFRWVQRIGLTLSFFCLSVLLWPYRLPFFLQVTAGCGYVAGLTAALVSQFTTGGKINKSKRDGKFIAKRK